MVLGGISARAQRVYATTQTSSPNQTLLFVTLSEVTNATNPINSTSIADFSTLTTTVGLLSLIEAWQNLQFPAASKPQSNSPVTIKFGANSSIADVINGISIQPTNNGTLVGTAYAGSTIVGLLGSGSIDREITLPAPGVTYDGIRYQVSPSVLGIAVTGRYYYAFFITPPTVSGVTICNGSTATLTVTNPQTGYTYNWYNSSGTLMQSNTSSSYVTSALTATTSFTVEAVETSTGTSYYSGRTSVAVTVNNPPTTANAGTIQSLCSTTTTTLTGNTPTTGTGLWTKVSGPGTQTFGSAANSTTTVNGLTTGTYVFRWTISNAPCTASTSDVTVVVGAPVTASNAGTTQNLCNASGTTLAGNIPSVGTGTWTVVSGPNTPSFTNPNLGTTTVTGMVPGNYVFRWTISSGSCATSTSTVNVNNSAAPTTSIAGTNQSLCAVTTATLAGNSPTAGTGAWTQISGPNTASITTPSASNSGLTGLITGTYVFRWTISNAPCPASTSDVSITISATPSTANAGPDQLLCSVSSTTLAGNLPATGTGLWNVVSGPNTPTFTSASTYNTGITNLVTGTYVLSWTISNGACTPSTDNVTLIVGITPTITLGTFPSACREITSATLAYTGTTGTPSTYSITWNTAALTAGFTNVSNAALPASPITITVPVSAPVAVYNGTIRVRNAGGCESTAVPFTLNVHPKPASPSFSVTTN